MTTLSKSQGVVRMEILEFEGGSWDGCYEEVEKVEVGSLLYCPPKGSGNPSTTPIKNGEIYQIVESYDMPYVGIIGRKKIFAKLYLNHEGGDTE